MTAINFTAKCNVVFACFLGLEKHGDNGDQNEMGVRGKHKYEGIMKGYYKGEKLIILTRKKGVRRIKEGRGGMVNTFSDSLYMQAQQ